MNRKPLRSEFKSEVATASLKRYQTNNEIAAALNTGLDDHLGYGKSARSDAGNYRNGTTS